ncbi:hypothetical protein LO771_17265 [Streptacidiphilus sp. ASG 303]|uniref:hypothetical protein n=1 Tax=Streptacidiphilus sp. ASG 303 TaxID=2896847 RepID=UPI001E5ADC0F|nr:hypothetical protein [Streptacidiphilus sp. ASG 303]MCD0484094.1 hypothetical protein [Streptacidiphilus sp. ASG 303]
MRSSHTDDPQDRPSEEAAPTSGSRDSEPAPPESRPEAGALWNQPLPWQRFFEPASPAGPQPPTGARPADGRPVPPPSASAASAPRQGGEGPAAAPAAEVSPAVPEETEGREDDAYTELVERTPLPAEAAREPSSRSGRAKILFGGTAVVGAVLMGAFLLPDDSSGGTSTVALHEPAPSADGTSTPSASPSSDAPAPRLPSAHASAARAGQSSAASRPRHATPTAPGTAAGGTPTRTAAPRATPTKAATRPTAAAPAPTHHWTSLTLTATSVLEAGQSARSDRTTLAMRSDGDLVVIDENGRTRWSAGTAGTGRKAVFQNDGNLVVYRADGGTAWSSGTPGHNGAVLVLRSDGNVVIQSGSTVIWQTDTAH